MRRIGIILSLSILIVIFSCSACFASGLELVDSYPKDGTGGLQPIGVAFKLHFNEDVAKEDIQKANKACMELTGKDKKPISLKLLHTESKPKDLLVIVDKDLEQNSKYTFTLSGDFQSSNGDKLGEDVIINFETRNTKTDMNVNMLIMGLMVVAMLFFSSRAMKRQMKKEEEEKNEADKVNPYKVAKETGKSVEAIVAKTQKEKDKRERRAKRSSENIEIEEENQAQQNNDPNVKRVKRAKPISETGSTYITGRKAEAEKRKSKSTNPKNMTGKNKNKKKK
ncbi:Ig-like domain-containing protein [Anaerovorax odorimutans]|uniref:Ig-like domain-containing protein n=1 Tax=Anaerovorax odorimutans TaxID=109327 RepID=UPI000424208C|nr:Ig-like domain-containing protein [Anaerovorax odorimutans]